MYGSRRESNLSHGNQFSNEKNDKAPPYSLIIIPKVDGGEKKHD